MRPHTVRHGAAKYYVAPDEIVAATRDYIRIASVLHQPDPVMRLHPYYDEHASRLTQILQMLVQVYVADRRDVGETSRMSDATLPAAFGAALASVTYATLGHRQPGPADAEAALKTLISSYFSAMLSVEDEGTP